MGCDMVVALGTATGLDSAFLAANSHRSRDEAQSVHLVRGRSFAAGETLQTRFAVLPQVRKTWTVLAAKPHGQWGYLQGVNDCRVAVGVSDWQSFMACEQPGLLGPELVRLTLERAASARQGAEILTDLIGRYGQGKFPGCPEGDASDHVFLIVDPGQAFAVEAAGNAWALQEIGQVRAAGDVAVIRQDWNRLSPGFADRAIAEGWWGQDGSKLDFLGAISETPTGKESALRRWGRLTWLIEQQNGRIDRPFLRRLLADHYEGTHFEVDPLTGPGATTPVCRHAAGEENHATAVTGVIHLPAAETAGPVYWLALGTPCLSVYFPLLLDGDLPATFGEGAALCRKMRELINAAGQDSRRSACLRETLGRLQTRFEQDLEEYLGEAGSLKQRGEAAQLGRLASSMMQSHVERFEEAAQSLLPQETATMAREPMAIGGSVF